MPFCRWQGEEVGKCPAVSKKKGGGSFFFFFLSATSQVNSLRKQKNSAPRLHALLNWLFETADPLRQTGGREAEREGEKIHLAPKESRLQAGEGRQNKPIVELKCTEI